MTPEVDILPLHNADGSASYSCNGYSVLAAINGPIEAQRKDELPEEAAIDVIIRPTSGVGGVRERHFESIIHKTLRHVILVAAHPRTLIQVTLQVTSAPARDSASSKAPQAASNISILPSLLQASMLALLSTSIPLKMTLTSTVIAVDSRDVLAQDPSPKQLEAATSVHVLTFSSHGDLLVVESEGQFDMDMWEKVAETAKQACQGSSRNDGDINMEPAKEANMEGFLKDVMGKKVAMDQRWKETNR